MQKAPKLSLLIPTYNESEIIQWALTEIAKGMGPSFSQDTEVIVVDDGSDDLPEVVAGIAPSLGFYDVRVLRNNPPLGKGRSLNLGFEAARGPVAGFMDVDLSTPPKYIKVAFETVNTGRADILIGSRRAKGAVVNREQSWIKDILGYVLGFIARGMIFNNMRFYEDTQCGFKFFKTSQARLLYRNLLAPDGVHDLEVLIRANLAHLSVEEMGVEWTDLRESKRPLRRVLLGEMKSMVRIILNYKIFSNKNFQIELKKFQETDKKQIQ